ncbi:MAG: sodium:proton antiporter, partial [Clostridia bacterium]|nr:sodium:proton antiporter [Clostridia bacterium]
MELWQSIPFACILLPLGSAAVTSVMNKRWSRYWTMFVLSCLVTISAIFVFKMQAFSGSYTYMMGHYSAPWGNEIRAGML